MPQFCNQQDEKASAICPLKKVPKNCSFGPTQDWTASPFFTEASKNAALTMASLNNFINKAKWLKVMAELELYFLLNNTTIAIDQLFWIGSNNNSNSIN